MCMDGDETGLFFPPEVVGKESGCPDLYIEVDEDLKPFSQYKCIIEENHKEDSIELVRGTENKFGAFFNGNFMSLFEAFPTKKKYKGTFAVGNNLSVLSLVSSENMEILAQNWELFFIGVTHWED